VVRRSRHGFPSAFVKAIAQLQENRLAIACAIELAGDRGCFLARGTLTLRFFLQPNRLRASGVLDMATYTHSNLICINANRLIRKHLVDCSQARLACA
jgi:hypothetical protein